MTTTRNAQGHADQGSDPGVAILAKGVTRSYRSHQALGGVDLEVKTGEVVAILGPNGAGKTTLVEVLEGLRRRDGGDVVVLGQDPRHGNESWRARIGAVLQLGPETDEFTVAEMLSGHAAYYPNPRSIAEVVDALDLQELADQRIKRLSGGQRRRLDIALGVIGHPELLFLDEPTTGLDPEIRRHIWDLIRQLANAGTTIVLTTHYLDEVEHLAERTVVLVDGQIVWEGRTAELRNGSTRSVVTFALDGSTSAAQLPDDLPGTRLPPAGLGVRYETDDPTRLVADLMAWAARSHGQHPVTGLEITRPTLEEAYLDLLETAHDHQEESQ